MYKYQKIGHDGREYDTLMELCEDTNIPYQTVYHFFYRMRNEKNSNVWVSNKHKCMVTKLD